MVYIKMGLPEISMNCFGIGEFILSPKPPATIMTCFFTMEFFVKIQKNPAEISEVVCLNVRLDN